MVFFLFGFICVLGFALSNKIIKLNIWVELGIALFLGSILVSTGFGIYPLGSLRELIIFLGYFFILFSIVLWIDEDDKLKLWGVLVFAGFLSAGFALRQYFGGFEATLDYLKPTDPYLLKTLEEKRIFGLTFSPDFFASQAGMTLILFLAGWVEIFRELKGRGIWFQIVFGIATGLIFLVILLSKSVGGMAALSVGIGGFGLSIGLRRFKRKGFLVSFVLSLGLAVLIIFSILIYLRRDEFSQKHTSPLWLRLDNFRAGLVAYKDNPSTGVGLGNFWIAYPKYRSEWGNEVRYVHNNYIQILAECGPISLLGFLIILGFWIYKGLRWDEKASALEIGIFGSGLVFFSHSLVDFDLYVPEVSGEFFAIFGLLLASGEEKREAGLLVKVSGAVFTILFIGLAGWLCPQDIHLRAGQNFMAKGDYDNSIKEFDKVLKLNQNHDIAIALKARALWLKKPENPEDSKEVVELYNRAMVLNPRIAFYPQELGDFYFEQGFLKASKEEYKKALLLYPNNGFFNLRMGEIEWNLREREAAIEFFKKASMILESREEALTRLALSYRELGMKDDLKKVLLELIKDTKRAEWAKRIYEEEFGDSNK